MGQVNAKRNSEESILITDSVRKRLQNLSSSQTPETEREPAKEVKNEDEEREGPYLLQSTGPAIADKESELTQNKNYWKRRLEELQENQKKIKEVMLAEKEQGFNDVQGTLGKVQADQGPKPCTDNEKEVLKCYQEHSKEPLNCEKEVAVFVSCVKTFKR